MQAKPRQPGQRPGEAHADGQLHHGRAAADGRHHAPVVIAEGLRRLAVHQAHHLLGRVLALLQGGLRELRDRVLLAQPDVADREDPVASLDPQVREDEHPAGLAPGGRRG